MTPNDITVFIRDQSVGDERLRDLLETCVGRLLRRDHLNVSRAEFARVTLPVPHIKDWLKASIVSDAAWLKNVDHLGRAKKLMKLGSIAACVKEADKAMLLANEKLKGTVLGPDDEIVEHRFEDDFTFVRLLSEKALDLESSRMGHCIGNGAYDNDLQSSNHAYLSLRSPAGHPHATLEIRVAHDADRDLRSRSLEPELRAFIAQASGKQNRQPLPRYVRYLLKFAEAYNIEIERPQDLGVAKLRDGRLVMYEDLQEGMSIASDLFLSQEHEISLPAGLSVSGAVHFTKTRSAAPFGIHSGKEISFLDCPAMGTLPVGLSAPRISVRETLLEHVDTSLIDTKEFIYFFSSPTNCSIEVPSGSLEKLSVWKADTVILGSGLQLVSLCVHDVEGLTISDDVVVSESVALSRLYVHGFPSGLRNSKSLTLTGTTGAVLDKEMCLEHLCLVDGTFSVPSGLAAQRFVAFRCSVDRIPSNERFDILDLTSCKIGELPSKLSARNMRIEGVDRFSRVASIETSAILKLSNCDLEVIPSIQASGLVTLGESSATSFGANSFIDGKLVLGSPSPDLDFENLKVTSPVFATLAERVHHDYHTEFPPMKIRYGSESARGRRRPGKGLVPRWNTNTIVGACLVEGGTLLYESNAPFSASVDMRNKRTRGSFETAHITKVRSGLIVGGDLVLDSWNPIWKEVTNRGQWSSFTVEGNLVVRGYAATSGAGSYEALTADVQLEREGLPSSPSPRIVVEGDLDCRRAVSLPPLELFDVKGRVLPPRRLHSFRVILAGLRDSTLNECKRYSEAFFDVFSRNEKVRPVGRNVIERCRPDN